MNYPSYHWNAADNSIPGLYHYTVYYIPDEKVFEFATTSIMAFSKSQAMEIIANETGKNVSFAEFAEEEDSDRKYFPLHPAL